MDRRQNNGSVKAVSPRHCAATSALRNCCFNCRAGQSHKDNVRCTAVEEQPEAKEVQLSQPSSTSLLMISSGLTLRSSSTSLLLISPRGPCTHRPFDIATRGPCMHCIATRGPCTHCPFEIAKRGPCTQRHRPRNKSNKAASCGSNGVFRSRVPLVGT